jgi:uncharacterized protein with PCYCGC motif
MRKFSVLIAILAVLAASPSACTGAPSNDLHMLPLDEMPADVQASPAVVQQAYQFAAANPDLMKQIPCYCGCGNIGHTSNFSCYVSDVDGQGEIAFESHALGCSICVDITQDVMRLSRQGKSPPVMRAYIDSTYSKYGESNIP